MKAEVVQTFSPSSSVGNINLTDAETLLFFTANPTPPPGESSSLTTFLWRSDGSETGTFPLREITFNFATDEVIKAGPPFAGIGIDGKLFFVGSENEFGAELYFSDGTVDGNQLLKDINPEGSSNPDNFTDVEGTLFFTADDGVNGRELWTSDGTNAGTQLVADLTPGEGDSTITSSVDFNGTLIFDKRIGELWKSDGTEAGTELIRDFGGLASQEFTVVEDTLFFINAAELWRTDGTTEGTSLVADLPNRTGNLTAVGDTLFFTYIDPDLNIGEELWKSDGTSEGTQLVRDIRPEERQNGTPVNRASSPLDLIDVDGTLFFTADDGVNGRELWRSDGTADGTQLVKDITEGEGSTFSTTGNRSNFTDIDGTLYFSVGSGINSTLWKSDGTEAGTVQIDPEQISVGGDQFEDSFQQVTQLIELDDELFFNAAAYDAQEGDYVNALLTLSDVENEPGGNGTGNTVYRFFNNNAGVHFYTANEAERDAVQELDNFSFEGASYVGADPLTGEAETVPVYRFLNQDTGVHLYTISETERDAVQELDNFSFEGEAFFAYESEVEGSIPIYRFFNSTSGAHFYTPSVGERDNVEDNLSEFQSEGIAYYALPVAE